MSRRAGHGLATTPTLRSNRTRSPSTSSPARCAENPRRSFQAHHWKRGPGEIRGDVPLPALHERGTGTRRLLSAHRAGPLVAALADRMHHVLAGLERVVEAALALVREERRLHGGVGEGRIIPDVAFELGREVVVGAADV